MKSYLAWVEMMINGELLDGNFYFSCETLTRETIEQVRMKQQEIHNAEWVSIRNIIKLDD